MGYRMVSNGTFRSAAIEGAEVSLRVDTVEKGLALIGEQ
jgi:hypothetical protein